jgi:protein pelota
MKLIASNLKKNEIKVRVESLDDLWTLNYVIEKNDLLKARTLRKIKIGDDADRQQKIVKKPVFLEIKVEKVEFAKYTSILRVSGTVTQGPEDISLGSYHTVNVEENTEFELVKEKFLNYQLEKLKESFEDKSKKILICVHDREDAFFATMKKYGYEMLTTITGNVEKKSEATTSSSDFYMEIAKMIEEYD